MLQLPFLIQAQTNCDLQSLFLLYNIFFNCASPAVFTMININFFHIDFFSGIINNLLSNTRVYIIIDLCYRTYGIHFSELIT